ncbi:uncharacterized protein LOC118646148 [Monomorium pharaonis]|uniref:uncharacterized protein LOC118646148 n=1 Tax=Monomorium pharaonis TaxID=307658 RepID=UPI00174727BB|nr:uncharacterized protein LOC118646148 [Monomorium pharaonis]
MSRPEDVTLNPFGMDNQEESQASKISIRLPPFWPDEPELWFAQLEGQFALCKINRDVEKYAYALSKLEPKQAREVKDIITQPPETEKYEALKKALIQRLTDSQDNRMRQLLEREEIGDRKPSQFLRYLKALAEATVSSELLRTLWLGRLLHPMQAILATRTTDELDEVAEQADRIHELGQKAVVLATSTAPREERRRESQKGETELEALRKEVAALTTQVSRMARSMMKQRQRTRSRSRSRTIEQNGICYYHRRFGNEAKKCTQPCTFTKNDEGSH